MATHPTLTHEPLTEAIRTEGFRLVRGQEMRRLLEAGGPLGDWDAFVASSDDLRLDTYMDLGGRYRKRRHAVFAATEGAIARRPQQPHYQSRDYNALNGGIERWFAPVLAEDADGPTMQAVLRFCHTLFDRLKPSPRWHVEVHQFRIEARPGAAGQPTPEGMHRDGVDYVLVLLVRRSNIQSGETSIHDLSGHTLGSFTLTDPLDAALVDDARVMHGVTAVEPLDPSAPAARDVLVVTFRAEA
jgi:hypothetical protein